MVPDLRALIDLVEAASVEESYEDDSDTAAAREVSQNLDLVVGDFKAENEQLANVFRIGDEAVRRAVRDFTYESTINAHLIAANGQRSALPAALRDQYDKLMSLYGTRLPETHHVYSGTGSFDPMTLSPNGVFSTPAFLSASLSVRVAAKTSNFRRTESDGSLDHILHFVLPEGFMGGFYLGHYSHDPEELEYLVFPTERFKFLSSQPLELDSVTRTIHHFRPVD